MVKKFQLGDTELKISESLVSYNEFRSVYISYAIDAKKKYIELHERENGSLRDLVDNFSDHMEYILFPIIDQTINRLFENKIYSIDADTFLKDYYKGYITVFDEFEKYENAYEALVRQMQDNREYREARKASRGRFYGGGFGLSGAIKGMALAGAANMATGAMHSITNGIGNARSDGECRSMMRRIFEDPDTLISLSNAVYDTVLNLNYAYIDALEKNLNIRYDKFSLYNYQKAATIYNNIIKVKPAFTGAVQPIKDMLLLYPYDSNFYHMIIQLYGDAKNEIEAIGEFFYININKIKSSFIHEELKDIKIEDYKNFNQIKTKLEKRQSHLGIKDITNLPEVRKIRKKLLDVTISGIKVDHYKNYNEVKKHLTRIVEENDVTEEYLVTEYQDKLSEIKDKIIKRNLNSIDILVIDQYEDYELLLDKIATENNIDETLLKQIKKDSKKTFTEMEYSRNLVQGVILDSLKIRDTYLQDIKNCLRIQREIISAIFKEYSSSEAYLYNDNILAKEEQTLIKNYCMVNDFSGEAFSTKEESILIYCKSGDDGIILTNRRLYISDLENYRLSELFSIELIDENLVINNCSENNFSMSSFLNKESIIQLLKQAVLALQAFDYNTVRKLLNIDFVELNEDKKITDIVKEIYQNNYNILAIANKNIYLYQPNDLTTIKSFKNIMKRHAAIFNKKKEYPIILLEGHSEISEQTALITNKRIYTREGHYSVDQIDFVYDELDKILVRMMDGKTQYLCNILQTEYNNEFKAFLQMTIDIIQEKNIDYHLKLVHHEGALELLRKSIWYDTNRLQNNQVKKELQINYGNPVLKNYRSNSSYGLFTTRLSSSEEVIIKMSYGSHELLITNHCIYITNYIVDKKSKIYNDDIEKIVLFESDNGIFSVLTKTGKVIGNYKNNTGNKDNEIIQIFLNNVLEKLVPLIQNENLIKPKEYYDSIAINQWETSLNVTTFINNKFLELPQAKEFHVWNESPNFAQLFLNAVNKYAPTASGDEPLLLYDDTIFKNGKSGFILTKQRFICSANKVDLPINSILQFEYGDASSKIFIKTNDRKLHSFSLVTGGNFSKATIILNELLNYLSPNKTQISDTNQERAEKEIAELEQMCEKLNYMNLTQLNDLKHEIETKDFFADNKQSYLNLVNTHINKLHDQLLVELTKGMEGLALDELYSLKSKINEYKINDKVATPYMNRLNNLIYRLEKAELDEICADIEQLSMQELQALSTQIKSKKYNRKLSAQYLDLIELCVDQIEVAEIEQECADYMSRSREELIQLKSSLSAMGYKRNNINPFIDIIDKKINQMDFDYLDKLCNGYERLHLSQAIHLKTQISNMKLEPKPKEHFILKLVNRITQLEIEKATEYINFFSSELIKTIIPVDTFSVNNKSANFEMKFNRGLNTYITLSEYETPIFLFDTTFLQDGGEGFVLTNQKIHFKGKMLGKGAISILDIQEISSKKQLLKNELIIITKSGHVVRLPGSFNNQIVPNVIALLTNTIGYIRYNINKINEQIRNIANQNTINQQKLNLAEADHVSNQHQESQVIESQPFEREDHQNNLMRSSNNQQQVRINKFCSSCGKPLSIESKFCGYCGSPVK